MPFHKDVHETMMEELAEVYRRGSYNTQPDVTERAVLESRGYDVDCTPIDTLMRDQDAGLYVAHAMEHGDEAYEC